MRCATLTARVPGIPGVASERMQQMAAPPEVLFDRFFQRHYPRQTPVRPEDSDPRSYKGKQDLNALRDPSARSLLAALQEAFNEGLRNEKQNVPEHVKHPPFHFDYVDSNIPNALAFQYEDYSFIGITFALIHSLWSVCVRLNRSDVIHALLGVRLPVPEYEALHVVLFRVLLWFVV